MCKVDLTAAAGALTSSLLWIPFLRNSKPSSGVLALAPVGLLLPPSSPLVQGFCLVQASSHLRPLRVTQFLPLLSSLGTLIVAGFSYNFPVLRPENKSQMILVCLFLFLIF